MSDIIKLLSVNLDEVYCMRKNCACKTLSVDLYALSSKVDQCCEHMTIALSEISISLSTINEKIDFLSGKIDEISGQLSTEEKLPPTIFAYSTEDAQVTAMLRQAGVWNREPFPGYISSADTELIIKLSSVMDFDFPKVAELNDYRHSWDSETINPGTTNYCSYSKMQYEGIVIPDFDYIQNYPMPESETSSIYVAEKDRNCLINARIIPMDVQSEITGQHISLSSISSYTDPENLDDNNNLYIFGKNETFITYRPIIYNRTMVFGSPIVKDGKKYFGIKYTMGRRSNSIKVEDIKPNAERQYLSVYIVDSDLPGPFEHEGQLKYETTVSIQFGDDPIPPTIYHN